MSNKDSKTKAFETVNAKQKGFKSEKSRQRFVIAIFAVVVLILAAFSTLVGAQLIERFSTTTTTKPTPPSNVTYIPKDAGDIKIGNLLFISDDYQYSFPQNVSGIVNLWEYKNNSANDVFTKIRVGEKSFPTYELYGSTHANRITLESNTLDAFNKMLLDYCSTLDLTGHEEGSASHLFVAWGHYEDVEEYENDLKSPSYGKDYYDHALGTSLTLRYYSDAVNEKILKDKYTWIYENAHKYGFIIRFPGDCKDHTGYDSSARVHLRYVGTEHATYIYENGICLEEYLETLRVKHGFENPLKFEANGNSYEVYYVKYSGNPTSLPVPKDATYTVSGDNMNGFIVTVTK